MADFKSEVIEESKEPKEGEREMIAAKRAEENLKRLREFERHLKEAPRFQFNTNVFKKGVKFAQESVDSGEIQRDEELVRELARFLSE